MRHPDPTEKPDLTGKPVPARKSEAARKPDLGRERVAAGATAAAPGAYRSPAARRLFVAWLLCALILLGLDQASKQAIQASLQYGQRIDILPFFDLTLLYNTGAAFSFLADAEGTQRWLFTALAAIVSVFILVWLYRHAAQRLLSVALLCILAGAIGNAIDRVHSGHVIDFLLFYWQDWYFPAFNVADTAITCGAILLITDEILRARRARSTPDRGTEK